MKRDLTDTLDIALEAVRRGEPVPDVLERHAGGSEELQQLLVAAAALSPLRVVEMPTRERRTDDRNQFLAAITRVQRQPVSAGTLVRAREWFAHRFAWRSTARSNLRREPRRMNALVLKFMLVVAMLFGSAGGTAVAAANSLPGSPLYPAKLAMEQARLQVAADPSDQAQLHMILAQLRVQEMEQLALAGREPGQAVLQQLQQHLNEALRLAAGMPDEDMQGTLAQWQEKIQQQEQALQQAQARAAGPAQEPLHQALQILQQTRQQLQAGLENGRAFRWQHALGLDPDDLDDAAAGECVECEPVGDEYQYRRGSDEGQPSPGEPGGNQYRNCTDCEPEGDAHRFGPQPETPAGPGTGTCDDCETPGDQHQYGSQPEPPGSGEPGGPAEPPCDGCEPDGDQHQYGPEPEQPGPGQPGGPEEPPCDGCEPPGDQHQYGPEPEQPGPGEPGGPAEPPCDDCEPDGDQHQVGPDPEQPGPGEPPAEPGPADDAGPGGGSDAGGAQGGDGGGKSR